MTQVDVNVFLFVFICTLFPTARSGLVSLHQTLTKEKHKTVGRLNYHCYVDLFVPHSLMLRS
jgi:hypothetical protein